MHFFKFILSFSALFSPFFYSWRLESIVLEVRYSFSSLPPSDKVSTSILRLVNGANREYGFSVPCVWRN